MFPGYTLATLRAEDAELIQILNIVTLGGGFDADGE